MNDMYKFIVLPVGGKPDEKIPNIGYLITDNWDDYFEYSTQYYLVVVDENKVRHNIGDVKIGQIKMIAPQRRPGIPEAFTTLGDKFFSVGQSDSYYENLKNLGDKSRNSILVALRDIAFDEKIYKIAIKEKITSVSILRFISPLTVKGQFRRLANGGARLSKYSFEYQVPGHRKNPPDPFSIKFSVEPESNPPTNIHVLIGRNGVGKTFLLTNMLETIIEPNTHAKIRGSFISTIENEHSELFTNVVSVSFSAFDENEPHLENKDKSIGVQYSYIGLKRASASKEGGLIPKSPQMLKEEFVQSLRIVRTRSLGIRWKRVVEMLNNDPIFKGAEIPPIIDEYNEEDFDKETGDIFSKLSSGHKIVLLTLTRLVETVEERSLILIDEPEAHLHPPLLSAFIRSLSELLIERNGVAIIATHSPIVLQEVPRNCVWLLRRNGQYMSAERLEIETFGENVGILTREVFGLEVTHSGFHELLRESAEKYRTYQDAIDSFDSQLGMEAKAILMGLYSNKNNGFEE